MHHYEFEYKTRIKTFALLGITSVSVVETLRPLIHQAYVFIKTSFICFAFLPESSIESYISATLIFWFSYWLYSNHLWKLPFISEIPNIQGTWAGQLRSKNLLDVQCHNVVIYIHQTWDNIQVRLKTENSASFSTIASLKKLSPKEVVLSYAFDNSPNSVQEYALASHKGLTELTIDLKELKLTGKYFTDSQRRSYGDIFLKLVDKKPDINFKKALDRCSIQVDLPEVALI